MGKERSRVHTNEVLKVETAKRCLINVRKFFRKQRLQYLKKNILRYCSHNNNSEYDEIVKFLKSNPVECYNYNYTKKYKNMNVAVCFDESVGLYYVVHNNNKMYMKKGWTAEQAREYYRFIAIEQDNLSPHLYFTEDLKNKRFKKIVDLGAAEGNFTLDTIERCEHAYVFECDPNWIEALKATFRPWQDKVHLITAFVSNTTQDGTLTLDDYFKDDSEDIDLIKIDVEGEELPVLQGSSHILQKNKQVRLLICAYHYQNEENEIRSYLSGWNIKNRNGYIVMIDDKKQRKPYLRRGILEATRSC